MNRVAKLRAFMRLSLLLGLEADFIIILLVESAEGRRLVEEWLMDSEPLPL